MKRFILCLLLASCGGGGGGTNTSSNAVTVTSSNTPLVTHDYRQFAPLLQSVTRTFNQGKFRSVVIDANAIDITWSGTEQKPDDTTEEHRIRGDWIYMDAYRSGRYRWESIAIRSEMNYGQGWTDITPKDGFSLYGPVIVPAQGFTLRQWGCIRNDTRYQPAGCEKRWFHQHRVTYAGLIYNSCWQGIGDSRRPALRQEEVWWDSAEGWKRGTGTLKDGEPTGEGIVYEFYQDIAKDAGYVWQGTGLCLIN